MSLELLLKEFLEEDCDALTAKRLLEQIREHEGSDVCRDHTFNRFNLCLDFAENKVRIEDDLNPGAEGQSEMPLAEFKFALESASNR